MKLKLLLASAGLSFVTVAGGATNPLVPPSVKSAIERFAQTESGFQPKLGSPGFPKLQILQPIASEQERVCSIPLREKWVDPAQFRTKAFVAPRIADAIGHPPPAPKCRIDEMAGAQ